MGREATPEKRILVQWNPAAASMVEVEAFCASLEKYPPDIPIHLTLSIEGLKVPKFSELKKLLHLLEPLVQKEGTFHIYCEQPDTQKLLEFCGFPFIAQLIKEAPTIANSISKLE